MRSAQRKKRIENEERKKVFVPLIFKIAIIVIVLMAICWLLFLSTKYWDGKNKFVYTFPRNTGDVAVTVLDPSISEMTTMVIPADTQVDVAENYGALKIKNLWQLGKNEKKGGRLVSETVTTNFLFPTFLWSDSTNADLTRGSLSDVFNFILKPGNTNIPFGDRVMAGLFALRVSSLNKTEVNLGKTQYVKKQILNDGTNGYLINGRISENLTVYFSDNDFVNTNPTIKIDDQTDSYRLADNMGEVLQVMGGKIATIDRSSAASDTDCIVFGSNTKTLKRVVNIFGCKESGSKTDFDLEIVIGSRFAKRF